MIVIVEDRELVIDGFAALFGREGVATLGVSSDEAPDWLRQLKSDDLAAIEAVLVGSIERRDAILQAAREAADCPVIAVLDMPKLGETLALLDAGYDDVLRKPIHVREIMARVRHCARRMGVMPVGPTDRSDLDLVVPVDGRAVMVHGQPLLLPRREQRILEYFFANRGRRITKSQLFAAVYGIEDGAFEETVIESHVSKLRKKLRSALGYDPINSQRYLGYQLDLPKAPMKSPAQGVAA